jgi:hypothetical protein
MHALFVFSSIQPYLPAAIAVFFYLEGTWGCAPLPLSIGACYTLATIGSLSFSKHTGGGGASPASSSQCVYLQFAWGVPLPPLWWSVPHFSHCYKLSPLQGCWVGAPLLPSLAGLFIYSSREGVPLPHSMELGRPTLFAMCLFFFFFLTACLLFSLFFPLGGSQSVHGAMLICPRFVCGSITCHLAHLLICFSQAG